MLTEKHEVDDLDDVQVVRKGRREPRPAAERLAQDEHPEAPVELAPRYLLVIATSGEGCHPP